MHNIGLAIPRHTQKTKKIITMKKSILILMMVATGFFCFGQNSKDSVYSGTDSVYTGTSDSVKALAIVPHEPNGLPKAELAKAIESGTIYNSTSPYHNILHEFTYLVAMRDYCDTTLSQLRATGKADGKLSEKLKRKLSGTKTELASSKFNGFKIEPGMYDLFLRQIHDRNEWQKK